MVIDNNLKMILVMSAMIEQDDIFFDALDNDGELDKDVLRERYEKNQFLVNLCIDLIVDYKQTELDWQYVKDEGLLCMKAYEWFKDELKGVK